MITGRKLERVTKEYILEKVHPLSVYEFYMGERVQLNRLISSPFRRDNNPSFMISNKGGRYHHFDYGDSEKKGGCIDFVMQIRRLNYSDAINLINYDMINNEHVIQSYSTEDYPVDLDDKKEEFEKNVSIIVKAKKFTKEALDYWNSYHITKEQLQREKIYLIDKVYLNHSRVGLKDNEMAFAYLLQNEYFKIYRPFAGDKSIKWRYNGPNNYIENLYEVEKGGKLLITKAKKCRLCIENVYNKVVNVQCETTAAFTEENVQYINDNFEEVYINMDNDETGVKSSWKITSTFGWKHINVPYKYLNEGIKDFSDFARKYDIEALQSYFTSKGIVN